MKILLFGANGQLGYEAHRTLFCFADVIAVDFPTIDFTNPNQVTGLISEVKPDLIYNAVAYTDVDKAESEIEKASRVNIITPGEIAKYCKKNDVPLIHFSTDYVFDGTKNDLYTEEDIPNPINVYGRTKLDGESAIQDSSCEYLIFRTSWVYSLRIGGFVNKVIKWAQDTETLRIVDDQIGNPTWARMLAEISSFLILKNYYNLNDFFDQYRSIYHLAGGGYASRYEWTKSIIENLPKEFGSNVKEILPVKSIDFSTPAIRPMFSALNCKKFESSFNIEIPDWKESLKLMLI